MNVRELAFCLCVLYQPCFFLIFCSLLLAGGLLHLTLLEGVPRSLGFFVFVMMDKDIVLHSLILLLKLLLLVSSLFIARPLPPFLSLSLALPVHTEVYNTSTVVESSLASSIVCDSPSILALCWNTT